MTVPTLMANANKQIYVTGLKKAYNQLQHAVAMQKAIEPHEYGLKFTEYLKLKPVTIKDQDKYWVDKNATLAQSKDGMIYFDYSYDAISEYGSSTFGVDINGIKGPNKYGRDIFYFTYYGGKLLPEGSQIFADYFLENYNSTYIPYWRTSNKCTTEKVKNAQQPYPEPLGCTGRVLEEGKMNY